MGVAHINCLRVTGGPATLLFPRVVFISEYIGGGFIRGNLLFDK